VRFGIANQGRYVGVGEKGVGEDFGGREADIPDKEASVHVYLLPFGRFHGARDRSTYGRLSMLWHDIEICSRWAESSHMTAY
jgi:hypothetical protein